MSCVMGTCRSSDTLNTSVVGSDMQRFNVADSWVESCLQAMTADYYELTGL